MKKVYEASSPGCSRVSRTVIDSFSSRTISAISRLLILGCFAVLGLSSVATAQCPGGACTITCPPDISLCLAPDNYGDSEITPAWISSHASSPDPACTQYRVWKDAMGMDELLDPVAVDCDDVGSYQDFWVSVEKPLWVECRSSLVRVRVHIKDCEPPEVVCPPMGMFVCNEDIPRPGYPWYGFRRISYTTFQALGGSATDACGIDTDYILYRDRLIANDPVCVTNRTYIREFWVYDVNGNHKGCEQELVVADNVPPTWRQSPQDLTIECSASLGFKRDRINAWLARNLTAANEPGVYSWLEDNCNGNRITINAVPGSWNTILNQIPDACDPNPQSIEVVFTATDNCGNETTRSARVILRDIRRPVIRPLPPRFYFCIDDVPDPDPDNVYATDNCTPINKLVKEHVGDVTLPPSPICDSKVTIFRTYRVTDCDGNSSTVVQRITVDDRIAPWWDPFPQSLNLMNVCDRDDLIADIQAWLDDNGTGIGKDNCGDPTVWADKTAATIADELLGFCGPPPGNINATFVTWRVRDACGNFGPVVIVQVRLMDNIPPTGTAPANAMYDCKEEVPAMTTAQITGVSDNCDPNSVLVEIVDNPPAADGCRFGPHIMIRRWRLTDCAGNTRDLVQRIEVKDLKAPTWTTSPSDLTVACDDPAMMTKIDAWARQSRWWQSN